MFISHPQYEFRFPQGGEAPSAKHWRMFELGLDAPWFLLSIETVDRTLCIAWEPDLIEVLRSHPAVVGITCMMPASDSQAGRWQCRQVMEVHLHQSQIGTNIFMVDAAGETFDSGLKPTHFGVVEKQLLWADPSLQARPLRSKRARHGRR